jgi:hypothetical protein
VAAHPQRFTSEDSAKRKIAEMDAESWLHAVESDGTIKAAFPPKA